MDPAHARRLRLNVQALSRTAPDWRAFSARAATLVTKAVGAEAWCVATADPSSLLMTGVVTDHGDPAPRFFELEYGVPDYLSQWELVRTSAHTGALSRATGGRLERSPRWREMLEPFGLGDQLRAALVTRGSCWGYVGLMRGARDAPFSGDQERLLADAVASLADGLRLATLHDQARRSEAADAPGLVMLDIDLNVSEVTPSAARLLGDLAIGLPAPAAIVAVAARAKMQSPSDGLYASSHIRAHGAWLAAHATRLGTSQGPPAGIAVIVEPARPQTLLDLFIAGSGLTAREADVARAVMAGRATDEIARTLFISPLTVQQHLKSIFDKVGVRSRRELASLVFDRHYRPLVDPRPPRSNARSASGGGSDAARS